jgi:hypothetical protein
MPLFQQADAVTVLTDPAGFAEFPEIEVFEGSEEVPLPAAGAVDERDEAQDEGGDEEQGASHEEGRPEAVAAGVRHAALSRSSMAPVARRAERSHGHEEGNSR